MTTTATVPAMYRRNGFNFTPVAADRVPTGCLALVRGTDVMQVHGYNRHGAQLTNAAGEFFAADLAEVAPIMGTDNQHHFDLGHGFGVWLRTGEVLMRFNASDTALCGGQNKSCRKPLAFMICCWNKCVTTPTFEPGQWKLGQDAFGGNWFHHADGTPCGQPYDDYGTLRVRDCLPIPRCPKCQQYDTLEVAMGAYGDTTTCRADGCGYSSYYSIGD